MELDALGMPVTPAAESAATAEPKEEPKPAAKKAAAVQPGSIEIFEVDPEAPHTPGLLDEVGSAASAEEADEAAPWSHTSDHSMTAPACSTMTGPVYSRTPLVCSTMPPAYSTMNQVYSTKRRDCWTMLLACSMMSRLRPAKIRRQEPSVAAKTTRKRGQSMKQR